MKLYIVPYKHSLLFLSSFTFRNIVGELVDVLTLSREPVVVEIWSERRPVRGVLHIGL